MERWRGIGLWQRLSERSARCTLGESTIGLDRFPVLCVIGDNCATFWGDDVAWCQGECARWGGVGCHWTSSIADELWCETGDPGGPLSRGRRVFRNGKPVLLCARVRGPSGSFTWPVTTGGVMHRAGSGGYRTLIAAWAGVRVVQPGPAGFAKRSAIGDPGGAVSEAVLSSVGGSLIRMGEVPPRVLLPPLPSWRPPPLPCGRPRPRRSALDSKEAL